MHIEMLLHLLHMVEASRQALPHLDVGLMETSTGADVANVPPVGLSQPWCESHKVMPGLVL